MSDPVFFRRTLEPSLADILEWTGARPAPGADLARRFTGVAPLEAARSDLIVFVENPRYLGALAATRAGACFVEPRWAERVPSPTLALLTEAPARAFAQVLAKLFPTAMRPGSLFGSTGLNPGASVHPDARLEPGVVIDPGAVIGPRAEIGAGTMIGPNSVIGPDVRLGRDCAVAAQVTILNALIGNRVIIHAGARIGQDGFGFVPSPQGHLKMPQIGRVIIQDDVEIGANTAVDRGTTCDTVIGEGTKIDNLVQIAHNVMIGRHCLIAAQVGISGSTEMGDFVVVGGQAGFAGHLSIGPSAQIAAQSGVMTDVAAGARLAGSPALPLRAWLREHVRRAMRGKSRSGDRLA